LGHFAHKSLLMAAVSLLQAVCAPQNTRMGSKKPLVLSLQLLMESFRER
jgi:hypothetical protein